MHCYLTSGMTSTSACFFLQFMFHTTLVSESADGALCPTKWCPNPPPKKVIFKAIHYRASLTTLPALSSTIPCLRYSHWFIYSFIQHTTHDVCYRPGSILKWETEIPALTELKFQERKTLSIKVYIKWELLNIAQAHPHIHDSVPLYMMFS